MYFTPNDGISGPKAVSHYASFESQALNSKRSVWPLELPPTTVATNAVFPPLCWEAAGLPPLGLFH